MEELRKAKQIELCVLISKDWLLLGKEEEKHVFYESILFVFLSYSKMSPFVFK